jgi:transposase|tara:strand:- start:413 stop:1540 length:1128 start_codon:yes stop_codon:yes gene_type:complete
MRKSTKIVAMDIHKDSITVAVAEPGRKPSRLFGDIPATSEAVAKLAQQLGGPSTRLRFCYEAGPCGYGVYRQLSALGHECTVVAPSLIPRRPGDRIKTDPRDAVSLAALHRSGELTSVWVPDEEQEAMRDLERCREDMKHAERRLRQRLGAFLLRYGRIYPGRSRWGQAHFRWLETQGFDHPTQQIVFQEYVDAVKQARERVEGLEKAMHEALADWSLEPETRGLMALRGVAEITAVTVMAELGDLTRFDTPRQLMAFVGLVPSEHSSGAHRRRGSITKAGNAHVRRVLAESAWCYRFQARKTACLQRRAEQTTPAVQAIAWKAQKRLCGRYHRLTARGMPKNKVCTAIARELLGFIWAIAWELRQPGSIVTRPA